MVFVRHVNKNQNQFVQVVVQLPAFAKDYATRERFLQRIRQYPPNLQKILSRDGVFNCYSSTCTAKSPFAVNRGFNYGCDRHFGVYY